MKPNKPNSLSIGGMQVIESPLLPLTPSDRENARRMVRQGLAEVLTWLGEEVGPEPFALTHMMVFQLARRVHVSPEAMAKLRKVNVEPEPRIRGMHSHRMVIDEIQDFAPSGAQDDEFLREFRTVEQSLPQVRSYVEGPRLEWTAEMREKLRQIRPASSELRRLPVVPKPYVGGQS